MLGLHDGSGSREGLFGCRSECDDDGLVKHVLVFNKDHIDGFATFRINSLLLKADEREYKNPIFRDSHRVVSIQIGVNPDCCPGDQHGRSGQRLAAFVRNGTCHSVLGPCCTYADEQAQRDCK